MDLYVVRHGVTAWNREGRIQGHKDVPLIDAGRSQARALARRFAATPFDAAYASDLSRAVETARLALGERELPLITTPALREIGVGEWEGRLYTEIGADHPAALRGWLVDPSRCQIPGGETLEGVQARLTTFIDGLAERHAGHLVLVVAHGTALRAWLCGVLGMPLSNLRRLTLDSTAVTRVRFSADRLTVAELGCTAHLEGVADRSKRWSQRFSGPW